MRIDLLPTTTATRAAIIAAAQRRHLNQTAPVIILPPFAATNTAAAREAARVGHLGAHLALRARHQSSGLDIMRTLDLAQALDHQREALPDIATEAEEARAEYIRARAAYEGLMTIVRRVSTPYHQRIAAEAQATREYAAAASALARAEALERIISNTSTSDRADISQAAALAYWQTGNFALACKAAGHAIGAIAAAKGCTATRTKVMPISDEEAAQELAAHPNVGQYDASTGEHLDAPCRIPFNVRGGNSTTNGYYTIERRNSKRYPAGWYRVNHYYTTAPCISYEQYTSGEAAPTMATNGGINAVTDQTAAEQIDALITRAELSDRERDIVRYMLDNTAAAAGAKAVSEHQERTAERIAAAPNRKAARQIQREADRRTEGIRAAAIRDNAMTRAGVYADDNQRKTLERIRRKLDKAKSAPIDPTPAELDERERRTWARLQANRDRYTYCAAISPAPIIRPRLTISTSPDTRSAAAREYGREYAAQDITWRTDYPAPIATNLGRDVRTIDPPAPTAPKPAPAPTADRIAALRADLVFWAREAYRDRRRADKLADTLPALRQAVLTATRAAASYAPTDYTPAARAARAARRAACADLAEALERTRTARDEAELSERTAATLRAKLSER